MMIELYEGWVNSKYSIGSPSAARSVVYGTTLLCSEVPQEIIALVWISDNQFNELIIEQINIPLKNNISRIENKQG